VNARQNLKVDKVLADKNLLLVRGAIPAQRSDVINAPP
jgi:ribosomal protein L3